MDFIADFKLTFIKLSLLTFFKSLILIIINLTYLIKNFECDVMLRGFGAWA